MRFKKLNHDAVPTLIKAVGIPPKKRWHRLYFDSESNAQVKDKELPYLPLIDESMHYEEIDNLLDISQQESNKKKYK